MTSRSDKVAIVSSRAFKGLNKTFDAHVGYEPLNAVYFQVVEIMDNEIGPLAVERAIEEAQDD